MARARRRQRAEDRPPAADLHRRPRPRLRRRRRAELGAFPGDSAYPAPIAGYRVTVRIGSYVDRYREASFGAALDLLERLLRDAADAAVGEASVVFGRTYEPVHQVTARGEIVATPAFRRRLRAGIDIRGDGSAEAWVGHLRRQVVAREVDEDAYAALRRVVT